MYTFWGYIPRFEFFQEIFFISNRRMEKTRKMREQTKKYENENFKSYSIQIAERGAQPCAWYRAYTLQTHSLNSKVSCSSGTWECKQVYGLWFVFTFSYEMIGRITRNICNIVQYKRTRWNLYLISCGSNTFEVSLMQYSVIIYSYSYIFETMQCFNISRSVRLLNSGARHSFSRFTYFVRRVSVRLRPSLWLFRFSSTSLFKLLIPQNLSFLEHSPLRFLLSSNQQNLCCIASFTPSNLRYFDTLLCNIFKLNDIIRHSRLSPNNLRAKSFALHWNTKTFYAVTTGITYTNM